ncbi:hypothetical protein PHMEG_00037495 [Phytophthora megakarya]|uniref:Uncharacterized protein n=1 Tax=Phytophthora megakarya TaxID=4795 RepID=A0A225UKW7_9STRA|nr:hypothetical protein PHMEG_00037495 [Phytophthora megakarya]
MDKIGKEVLKLWQVSALPRSIKEKLKFWIRGTFNAGAAENFRVDLQQQIIISAAKARKKTKSLRVS